MRRPVNKMMQFFAMMAGLGVTSKQAYKDVMAKKENPASLSMFAEGVSVNSLSFKRVNGKWRVKR